MTVEQQAKLREIVRLIDEATSYAINQGAGYKRSEGAISVHYGTTEDRHDGHAFSIRGVEIYSYLLGPSRNHFFSTLDEALETVRDWHRAAMEEEW
ncbi:MAG TPA: hypothetical protein VFJ76_07840 [Solirubrobacterales bacterium]|nr:hypothetical protein [Solirubrobacterales bacterium]